MNIFALSIFVITYILIREHNAQLWSFGRLPADSYKPNNCSVPIEDSVPEFLQTCNLFFDGVCKEIVSTPYMYVMTCVDKIDVHPFNAPTCNSDYYPSCNGTKNLKDYGPIVYEPLEHPEEDSRLYPEIFDMLYFNLSLDKSYVKAYVNVLRKTFTGIYAGQYNYQWKEDEENEKEN